MTYARISGTGSYLPAKILSNAELETRVDTSDAWIQERTGIRTRHIAEPGTLTSALATEAAQRALEAAGKSAADLDLIILATTTPDNIFPSTACLVQQNLGNQGAPAFDIQAVCSGFVYALSIADKFIKTGGARCALVIGAEIFSRILDWDDRGTCILFGDGAGAVVLEASEEPGIICTSLHADGRHNELLAVPGHVAEGKLQGGNGFAHMQGGEVFKFAVNAMSSSVLQDLDAQGLGVDDVDWLIPHQANVRIINAVAKKMHFPADKAIVTVPEHGNTSAASIPLALDTAVRDGRVQRGQTLAFAAMGGGFTWGSALLTF